MLENYYITGLDIDLSQYNLGVIYQPSIRELLENSMTNLDFINPIYIIEKTYLDMHQNVDEELLTRFDLMYSIDYLIKDNGIFNKFKKILCMIYRVESEEILFIEASDVTKTSIFIKSRDVVLNCNNYEKLADIIFEMFYVDKKDFLKEDEDEVWVEKTGSKKEREMIEYFKNKKRKKQQKDSMSLADYINVVCHIKNFTPYKEVVNLTFYQLMNSYKSLVHFDRYKEELGYRWSFKFNFKDSQKHWSEYIKISKSEVE